MSTMDFGFPAPSSSSSSSDSDSERESDEMSECSSSEHSESEQSDTNDIPMHSDDSERHNRILNTMESLLPFVSMIGQQVEQMVRGAFRDGGGGFSALPPLLRFDDDDTNNGDGDGQDDTGDGDGDGGGDGDYYPYFDIGEGSGNYAYGRAYLDLLLDALTNHPHTVHVVDGSYFENVIRKFGSEYRFRYYRNRKPFAQLYVNLPPSALPLSPLLYPHPPPTSPSGGATDGNGSTICPTCHRKRSFDDSDSSSLNIEEGESSGKQQQETHPQENKKLRHQAEMNESTIDQQQKQNCGKLDVISEPNRPETNNEEEKQDTTANDGKHEQQKKGTDDGLKGDDNAPEKQNPDNRFKDK